MVAKEQPAKMTGWGKLQSDICSHSGGHSESTKTYSCWSVKEIRRGLTVWSFFQIWFNNRHLVNLNLRLKPLLVALHYICARSARRLRHCTLSHGWPVVFNFRLSDAKRFQKKWWQYQQFIKFQQGFPKFSQNNTFVNFQYQQHPNLSNRSKFDPNISRGTRGSLFRQGCTLLSFVVRLPDSRLAKRFTKKRFKLQDQELGWFQKWQDKAM